MSERETVMMVEMARMKEDIEHLHERIIKLEFELREHKHDHYRKAKEART